MQMLHIEDAYGHRTACFIKSRIENCFCNPFNHGHTNSITKPKQHLIKFKVGGKNIIVSAHQTCIFSTIE